MATEAQGQQVITLSEDVPVRAHADVVIVGGGPSGFIAAIAAARCGVSVILLEKHDSFGGLATMGLVNPISEFNKNGQRVISGIPWEFVTLMHSLGGAPVDTKSGNIHFNPEIYMLAAQRMLIEAGVKFYLNTHVSFCKSKEAYVTHIIANSAGNCFAVSGNRFVDCTGNADICFLAGVPMQDPVPAPAMQPATLCFVLDRVDTESLGKTFFAEENKRHLNTEVRAILEKLGESAKVPRFGGPWFATTGQEGIVTVNMTRTAVDATDPEDLSRAMSELREEVFIFTELLTRHVPAFRNSRLIRTAARLGSRETRHIIGLHTLTGEELLGGEKFEDTIACSAHPVDIHHAVSTSQDLVYLMRPGYIPYRSLITRDHKNLITAGRCISADQKAFASLRVQAPAMATGQAAGAAAALSHINNVSFQDLNIQCLQELLRKQNAEI